MYVWGDKINHESEQAKVGRADAKQAKQKMLADPIHRNDIWPSTHHGQIMIALSRSFVYPY